MIRTEGGDPCRSLSRIPKPDLLADHQHGTNDTLILADAGMGALRCKSSSMATPSPCTTTAAAGNDTLIAAANANNGLFGDARLI